ncbi:putative regulator of cell, partial [Escherichia coli PA32]
MLWVDSLYP